MDIHLQQTLLAWLLDPLTGRIALVLAGVIIVAGATRLLQRVVARHISDNSARYRARKIVTLIGYLGALIFITLVFNDKLGGLTIASGVASAGVAFALLVVLASVAGWVAISLGGFFKIGDRVQLGGIKGDVIDIGLLRTTIMQIGEWVNGDAYNGRIVRVANSFVFKEPVFNYSGGFPFLWDEIIVPVKYGSDHHLARKLIQTIAEEVVGEYSLAAARAWEPMTKRYMIEAASVRPMVTMTANHNWIEFTLRYTVDYKARRITKDRLFSRLIEEIDRSNGAVSIAASTVNVESVAPLDVRLTRGE